LGLVDAIESRVGNSVLGALVFYVLALFSKESAVAVPPLLLLAGVVNRRRLRDLIPRILPFVLCAIGYFGLIFAARKTHLHFNDAGTFSLSAPFLLVLIRSSLTLVKVWGTVSLILLLIWKPRGWSRLLAIAGGWLVITFLPYCFLTYNPSVPSRHSYLASVGLALLVAAALIEFQIRTAPRYRKSAIAVICGVIVAHQCAYLWIKKQKQFETRAEPTEKLVRIVSEKSPIHVRCFPYDRSLAELALRIRGLDPGAALIFDESGAARPDAVDFCFDPNQYHRKDQP
jgi:hypothetical protein